MVVQSRGIIFGVSDTRVQVSYTNDANENKETEIRAIQVGQGLVFGDKIFVVEWTNEDAAYREFNGFWANDEPDTTAGRSRNRYQRDTARIAYDPVYDGKADKKTS